MVLYHSKVFGFISHAWRVVTIKGENRRTIGIASAVFDIATGIVIRGDNLHLLGHSLVSLHGIHAGNEILSH